MYSKDLDTTHLVTQLQMLPELIWTYNECNPQTVIQRVTSLRTLCDVMNTVTVSRSMFNKLLCIVLTIPVTYINYRKVIFYTEEIKNVSTFNYVTDYRGVARGVHEGHLSPLFFPELPDYIANCHFDFLLYKCQY